MNAKKLFLAVLAILGAAAAVAGAAYMVLHCLDRKKLAPACIECDVGSEFEAE